MPMEPATRNDIESCRFLVRRSIFQTLEDSAELSYPDRHALWEWSEELLLLLDKEPFPVNKASQLASHARKEIVEPMLELVRKA